MGCALASVYRMLHMDFYEKALFVKTDVALAPCCRVQLLSVLRAMLLFAPAVSPLFGDSLHYEILLLGY